MPKLPSRFCVSSAGKTVILKSFDVVFCTSVGFRVTGGRATTTRRGGEIPSNPLSVPAASAIDGASTLTSSAARSENLRAKSRRERTSRARKRRSDRPWSDRLWFASCRLLDRVGEGRVVEAGVAQLLVRVDRQIDVHLQSADERARG